MDKETNQIAELNAEMWVVVTPDGAVLTHTLTIMSERASFWNFLKNFEGDSIDEYLEDSIAKLKDKGYRCIKASVNIKPIEQ